MRLITWNRSFRGLPNVDDGKDDFDSKEHETHATVLDKLLAWEKLYDEVKVLDLPIAKRAQQRLNTLDNMNCFSSSSTRVNGFNNCKCIRFNYNLGELQCSLASKIPASTAIVSVTSTE